MRKRNWNLIPVSFREIPCESQLLEAFCKAGHPKTLPYLWYDPCLILLLLPHHRVGLPSSSLAIGKDTDIVALEGVQQHLLPNIIVHTILRCEARIIRLQRFKQKGKRRVSMNPVRNETTVKGFPLGHLAS